MRFCRYTRLPCTKPDCTDCGLDRTDYRDVLTPVRRWRKPKVMPYASVEQPKRGEWTVEFGVKGEF